MAWARSPNVLMWVVCGLGSIQGLGVMARRQLLRMGKGPYMPSMHSRALRTCFAWGQDRGIDVTGVKLPG